MRRSLLVGGAVALTVVTVGLSGAADSALSPQPQWMIRDLGAAAGRASRATALNAAGQVVGSYSAGTTGACSKGFLWQKGTFKTIPADQCRGDMCVSNEALAITPRGRVLGIANRDCWTGGWSSFWLWPSSPQLANLFGRDYPSPPVPKKGQPAKTCSLAADGRTVCGAFHTVYDSHPDFLSECGTQNTTGVAINDRVDLVASLDFCMSLATASTLAPDTYVLAGPGGWVNFGPRGKGTVNALNAKGDVVGAIPVPAGGSHAFLWDGRRIVDLGTLGGRDSNATAINDRSEVVGTSATRDGAQHGFLWRNARMIDLGAVSPLAVNMRGQVLAEFRRGQDDASGRLHAVLWQDGRLSDLGYWEKADPAVYWLSLDDRGRVAGADEAGHAVVWDAGRRTRLPELPGAKGSAALAVNASAGIAGWSFTKTGRQHAVVWTLTP